MGNRSKCKAGGAFGSKCFSKVKAKVPVFIPKDAPQEIKSRLRGLMVDSDKDSLIPIQRPHRGGLGQLRGRKRRKIEVAEKPAGPAAPDKKSHGWRGQSFSFKKQISKVFQRKGE